MDVDVALVEEGGVDANFLGARLQVGQRGRGRLLHHLAQLARELQLALARGQRGLDEDDLAAGRRPHQAGRDARTVDALRDLVEETALAERGAHLLLVVHALEALAGRDLGHVAADQGGDLALQVAHAGLARVLADDQTERFLRDRDLAGMQAVREHLLGDQEALGDLHLLLLGVAREVQDLHPVAQRGRDGFQRVRGRDEHHLREVEGHVEVVVAEVLVLLGIEDLEQRRGRVAAPVGADLVDLVEHEHRIVRLRAPDCLQDATRHRPDVGPAVAADLGFVVHAAERCARELATHGAGDRLAERGLADSRRSDKAEDGLAAAVGRPSHLLQAAHREVLDDALLDLVQVVVVRVEDLARLLDVYLAAGRHVPRQRDHQLEVGSDDRRLW